MKNQLPVKVFLGFLFVVILFHLSIVFGAIPFNIVWGGRLQNETEMYAFEAVSILVNLFLVSVLLMKGDFINFRFKKRTIKVILWVFFALFVLNTLGNLMAKTNFEKGFAVVTLIFAVLIFIINKPDPNSD
jgi:membrane protease YdiL (CAAX protease family)